MNFSYIDPILYIIVDIHTDQKDILETHPFNTIIGGSEMLISSREKKNADLYILKSNFFNQLRFGWN